MLKVSQQAYYRFTLFVAIFIILLMSFFSYQKIKNLIDYSSRIQHVQEVQKSLERILSSVKEAESGQRGYLLSGDISFLQLFDSSLSWAHQQQVRLDTILRNFPEQRMRADSLARLVSEREMILRVVLGQRTHLESDSGRMELVGNLQSGKDLMDSIRGLMNRMQISVSAQLAHDRVEKDRLVNITPFFLLLLSGVSLVLLLISYFVMSGELKKRLEFERELTAKIEQLNRSNTDLEQFAYVASHDLQEPLRKIRSFGDRLSYKHRETLNQDGKDMIDKIQNAARRMQTLIDDLLSFSRLINVAGQKTIVDLNELVKEVIADMEIPIQINDVKISAGKLPEINAVPSMMRQLIQNLLANSIKFAKKDIPAAIKISSTVVKGINIPDIEPAHMHQNYYQLQFQDNGIGFDEKYLDKIFIIFQRLHGKMDYEGTGIGLAVCKKIMAIHHGYITAKSQNGEGSSFYLFFPVNPPEIK